MKKMHIWGLALAAVFAFSAVVVASAFAEEPVWLLDSAKVTAVSPVETTGELTLTELEGPLGVHAGVLCSGILDGTIGLKGTNEVTKVLTLAKTETESLVEGKEIACANVENCSGGTPLVWAEKLPWDSQLVLSGTAITDVTLNAAYEVDCVNSLVGLLEDLCEQAETIATLTNNTTEGDVTGTITSENLGLCTLSGKLSGDIVTDSPALTFQTGHTLAVSEE